VKNYKTCKAPVKHNKLTPSFLQAGYPSCHSTNSVKALKEKTLIRMASSNTRVLHSICPVIDLMRFIMQASFQKTVLHNAAFHLSAC